MRRFNNWLATIITKAVGTMYCSYAFAALAICGFPGLLGSGALQYVLWTSTIFLQLVLLSVLAVGQSLAADQRRNDADRHAHHLTALHAKLDAALNRQESP